MDFCTYMMSAAAVIANYPKELNVMVQMGVA